MGKAWTLQNNSSNHQQLVMIIRHCKGQSKKELCLNGNVILSAITTEILGMKTSGPLSKPSKQQLQSSDLF